MMMERVDRYSNPEALAKVASAPVSVCELIFIVTEGDRGHIALIRDGRGDSVTWEERYAIIWVARSFTHSSFPQIGRAIAHDHSSVIRGYHRAKRLRMECRNFRAFTDGLTARLSTRHRVQKSAAKVIGRVRG